MKKDSSENQAKNGKPGTTNGALDGAVPTPVNGGNISARLASMSDAADEDLYPQELREVAKNARNAEKKGDFGEAVTLWEKVMRGALDVPQARTEYTAALRSAGQWGKLIEILKEDERHAVAQDKVTILLAMADLYSTRLNNDAQAVRTLEQILVVDPDRGDIYDRLLASYERRKRWPDVVKTLAKKAEHTTGDKEKVALYGRVASLYIEKFSNQAEAMKAYEKMLSLDPTSDAAIAHLLEAYEKRRDWEKLLALKEKQIDAAGSAEKHTLILEVAELAAKKIKKPELCIHWWERVLEEDASHAEATAELTKLYERSKNWEKLAFVCEKQVGIVLDPAEQSAALQKLGLLYTDKLNNPEKAAKAWRKLLEINPDHRRAQDALKKTFLQSGDWEQLEAFYREKGKVDEFVRVIERQVDATDADKKLGLALRVATMYREELGKPDRATRAYEKVLTLDGKNLEAAEALVDLYEGGRDPRKLVRVLEIKLEASSVSPEKLDQMVQLAELCEQKLRDKNKAFSWWSMAYLQEPTLERAREELTRLAKETASWQQLVGVLEKAVVKLSREESKLPLLQTMASVLEEHLGDVERALAVNKQILDIDDGNTNAMDALERLYLGKQQFGELLDLYEKKLEVSTDPDSQKQLLQKIGSLQENEAGDDEKATAAFRQILVIDKGDSAALFSLERIYQRSENWEQVADVLEKQVAANKSDLDGDEYYSVLHRLGTIRAEKLKDPTLAVDAFRTILHHKPKHDDARKSLEALLDNAAVRVQAADVLEPIYRETSAWQSLIRVHEIQAKEQSESGLVVELLEKIGDIYAEKAGQPEKAFEAYSRCLRQDPSAVDAKRKLETISGILDDGWTKLVALYERILNDNKDLPPKLEHELSVKAADSYHSQLDNKEKAVFYYQKALEVDPKDVHSIGALEVIFSQDERYEELLAVLRKKEDAASADEKLLILFQIAALQQDALGNLEEAIFTYNSVLDMDSSNVKALRALDSLYAQGEQWRDVSDNIGRQLLLTEEPREKLDLLLRMADLRATRLGEVGAAVETYQQVLDQEADNRDAVLALEKLLADKDHEQNIAQILEPLYKQSGEWEKQAGVYEIMVRNAMDPDHKIELLHKIAELKELGDNAVEAFDSYGRAFCEEPSNPATEGHLERIARGSDRWVDLIGLYDSVLPSIDDEELKTHLLLRTAKIQEFELGDDTKAVETYEKILQDSPSNLDAISSIELVYERNADYGQLVAILMRKSEVVMNMPERKTLLFRAAKIQEDVLEDSTGAVATYLQVLDNDEIDTEALDALERIYIASEQWQPLRDVYQKKADLADDDETKKQMLYVLGQVHDRELDDVAKAIDTYQTILDIDAKELTAIHALDRLYTKDERWYELLQNLERQIELTDNHSESVALTFRIGKLWQHRLKDVSRATEAYKQALAIDSGHEETRDALDELLHGSEDSILAAQVLRPIYQEEGNFSKLVAVLEVLAAGEEDPHRRIDLLHELAELQEIHLEDSKAAFHAFARALGDEEKDETTLRQLERLSSMYDMWEEYSQLLLAHVEKTIDVPSQVVLLTCLARVFEQELLSDEKAIETHNKILEIEFDDRGAILALDRLYTKTENWTELVKILRREIQLDGSQGDEGKNPEDTVNLQFRLGQLLEDNMADISSALDVYREILVEHPQHLPTIESLESLFAAGRQEMEVGRVLEPLYEDAGEFEKLHTVYEAQLQGLSDPLDRQSMIPKLAVLAEKKLFDPGKALYWWCEGLVEDPYSETATKESQRLAKEIADWDSLVVAYKGILGSTSNEDVQKLALLRIADIQETQLFEPEAAVDSNVQVLGIDAEDQDALAALDRLYQELGSSEELVGILERRIRVTMDGDDIASMQLRRGQLFTDALGDIDAGLSCYQAVLEQDESNRAALQACEGIYFYQEDWKELYEVYERLASVANSDEEAAECYGRMAKIASEALQDSSLSQELWTKVLDVRGEDMGALDAVAALHARQEMWPEYVEVIERQIGVADEVGEQIRLYKLLGRVWSEKLERPRNAMDAWLAADQLDPEDLETLGALSSLYRGAQSWEELSQVISRMVEVGVTKGEATEDEMIELYCQLGQLEGDVLGRIPNALESWQRVLYLDPGDFRALDALEQLFSREGRWEECIAILEKRALVVDSDTARIETLLQGATLFEEKLDDARQAASLYEQVRNIAPANDLASSRLEAIYRDLQDWENVNAVLLERVEVETDSEKRIGALSAIAEVYEKELGDQENAFIVLQEAFKEDYSHERTGQELERLAGATNQWQDLLSQYSTVVKTLEVSDPESAASLWVKIGRWYGEHLSHVEWGIHSVQQALRIDPNHATALEALADLQRQSGAWTELVETLQRHASIETDTDRRVELLLNLADLLENQVQSPMQAIDAYQSALTVDADCLAALVSLDRLYRHQEMWKELITVLERTGDLRDDPEEVIRLKLEIGQIWDTRLNNAAQAIVSYQDVINLDPSNMPALRALEELYEKTGDSEAYLANLEAQLDVSPSDLEQVALYERMASAWEERFGKLDRAAVCLEKVIAVDERNISAYGQLERLYRQSANWDSLVETYRNHIMVTQEPQERIDLYCSMAKVYEQDLSDPDRSIEAFTDVLTLDPDDSKALDGLGRLYERISEWDKAINSMSQLVLSTTDPAKQVDLYHRLGRVTHVNLKNFDKAEEYLLQGMSINHAHIPTMESLVALYSDRGDWIKAAQTMVRAEAHTDNVLEKVKLLQAAAEVYLHQLHNREAAKEYFASVIALDPEYVDAAKPLTELYFEDEQWEALGPVLDMLTRKSTQEGAAAAERKVLFYRAAKCAENLEDYKKAADMYKSAYELDATYLPTLLGRADLMFRLQKWNSAAKIYQTILVQHRDSQNEEDVVQTYYRLGMVRQELSERRKALNMFEKALEIDPHHRKTLDAMVSLRSEDGDWQGVVHAKRSAVVTADTAEKVTLLCEIGDLQNDQLKNPQKSIVAYNEALEIDSSNHQTLQRLLNRYTETEQWKNAVGTIERFIALESDPMRRGPYAQAAGTICRDKLRATDDAIEYYNRALDDFFAEPEKLQTAILQRALKAFTAIDKILTDRKDWKEQERAYRKMIKRVPSDSPVLVQLWHALGEIYRSRLKDYDLSIKSFEVAQQLEPGNADRQQILAELYLMAGPEQGEKAIKQHWSMIQSEPLRYESYRALRKIYMDTNQYDKAWCVCRTLAFLKKADPQEMQFYEQYRPKSFQKAKSQMSEELWARTYHPQENRYISAIFGAIWQGPAALRGQPHKSLGLRRKDRRPPGDPLLFSRVLAYCAQVMAVPMPELYVQENEEGDILLANTVEKNQLIPSFVARRHVLQGRSERELAFISARKLDFMRPEHYLRLALPTKTELKTALLSAIALVKSDFPIPGNARAAVAQYLPAMQQKIHPQLLEQLSTVVHHFIQAAPKIDLAEWVEAVDATGYRLGFVLCDDLEVAARGISAEPAIMGGKSVQDKIRELVLYSISEDYFFARATLGLTIG